MSTESAVLTSVLKYLGARSDCRVWRNNTGSVSGIVARIERALIAKLPAFARVISDVLAPFKRGVDFGLVGSADVIGMRRVKIVGSYGYGVLACAEGRTDVEHEDGYVVVAQFLAVECKSDHGRQSQAQRNFQTMVESMGGLYILARRVEDLYPWFPPTA